MCKFRSTSYLDKKYELGMIIYHSIWLLDFLLKALNYTCPSILDEILLCKIIYEIIIEIKGNLTQIKMSHNSCHTYIITNKDD